MNSIARSGVAIDKNGIVFKGVVSVASDPIAFVAGDRATGDNRLVINKQTANVVIVYVAIGDRGIVLSCNARRRIVLRTATDDRAAVLALDTDSAIRVGDAVS